MKKYIHRSILILATITIGLLTGCGTSGPRYSTVETSLKPEPGKGLVIIYAKSAFWGGGPNKWKIMTKGELLTSKFKLGTFYAYQANPGFLPIWTIKNNPVMGVGDFNNYVPQNAKTIPVEPNQTYYLEFKFNMGSFTPLESRCVSKEEGEREIKNCKWLNPW
jgi:uncharacterized short protein YbdD (DUF466 family)